MRWFLSLWLLMWIYTSSARWDSDDHLLIIAQHGARSNRTQLNRGKNPMAKSRYLYTKKRAWVCFISCWVLSPVRCSNGSEKWQTKSERNAVNKFLALFLGLHQIYQIYESINSTHQMCMIEAQNNIEFRMGKSGGQPAFPFQVCKQNEMIHSSSYCCRECICFHAKKFAIAVWATCYMRPVLVFCGLRPSMCFSSLTFECRTLSATFKS